MLRSITTISTIFLLLTSISMYAQDTLTVFMTDQIISDETQVTVPFSFQHFDSISYFSFSIDFDSTRLVFNSLSYSDDSNLKEADFNSFLINSGQMGLVWTDPSAQHSSVEDSVVVFNLVLDLKGESKDSTEINFGNNPTAQEAGDVNGNEIPINTIGANITFEQQSTSVNDKFSKVGIRVEQNTPNPFSSQTQIAFEIAKSEEVLFEVFDMEGKMVIRNNSRYPKGINIIKLNKLQFNGTGVYQYSLTIKQKTITKKLILLN